MQCHVLLYKLQNSRLLEKSHIFYQSVLISVSLFSLLTQRRRDWNKRGGERGGNKANLPQQQKNTLESEKQQNAPQEKMPWGLSHICEIHFIFAILSSNSVTSNVNLSFPLSSCAICYPGAAIHRHTFSKCWVKKSSACLHQEHQELCRVSWRRLGCR